MEHHFSSDLQELARQLLEIGAVKFGSFQLKLHETKPDAPLSPIYFNLRTEDNPNPGPLTARELDLIAKIFARMIMQQVLRFDGICGIPNAGTPLAQVLGVQCTAHPLVTLRKTTGESSRKIDAVLDRGGLGSGARILLLDDVITGADTKKEALAVLREAGFQVTELLVVVDREQSDGVATLAADDCTTRAIFTMSELLDFYVHIGWITPDKQAEVLAYIAAN